MIPTQRAWCLASGTIGKTRSMRRPIRKRGNCGPGTLVTTRLKNRWRDCRRAAWPAIVGGAKSVSWVISVAPIACFDSFRSPIVSLTRCRRSTGSSHQTGSGAIMLETRLPSAPFWSAVRTLTGTIARISSPSVEWPRARR